MNEHTAHALEQSAYSLRDEAARAECRAKDLRTEAEAYEARARGLREAAELMTRAAAEAVTR